MSRINCNVTKDLLPLYADKVLSEDSVALVEEHLSECENCRAEAQALQQDTVLPVYDDTKPLQKASRYLTRHVMAAWLIGGGALVLIVGVYLLMNYLRRVEIPYSYDEVKDNLRVVSVSDITEYTGGTEIMLLYDGKHKNYDLVGFGVPVGERDGRIQVELTCYMTTTAYNEVNPLSNWNFYTMRYIADPALTDIVYYEPNIDFSDTYNDRIYNFAPLSSYYDCEMDITKEIEVVRLYYGRWSYNNGTSKPQLIGDRHLLWNKKGFEA